MKRLRLHITVILALAITISVLHGADMVMKLSASKDSFLEGEPVFVSLCFHNQGSNAAVVGLGKYLLGNIFLSTNADSTAKQSKRLLEAGIHPSAHAITILPQEKYETILLVDDWLTLPSGKHTLNVRIKWDESDLSGALPVAITKSSDEELEKTLKQMILEMARRGHLYAPNNELYCDGLKDACYNPRTKAALQRIAKTFTETNSLAILNEILLNYNRGVAD